MDPVEREQERIDRGDTPEEEDAFQQWQRAQRIASDRRRLRDTSRAAYLKRKAKREAKKEELDRLRQLREERSKPVKVVGNRTPNRKRRLGTSRGGRR